MKVWQIATGEPNRDYQDLFFDHDIMILGPAWYGKATTGAYAQGSANSVLRQVHSFAHKPQPGDRVIARLGHEVIGVGRAALQQAERLCSWYQSTDGPNLFVYERSSEGWKTTSRCSPRVATARGDSRACPSTMLS